MNMAALLAAKCDGGTLKSLTVRAAGPVLSILLLDGRGKSLQSINLDCSCQDALPLALIAVSCPRLVTLSLPNARNWELMGFSAMFDACRELKELTLGVHDGSVDRRGILKTIARQKKLRLQRLQLGRGFDVMDMLWFREQIKDRQVLPVPSISIGTNKRASTSWATASQA